ncbi:MAG: M23 family metallopeptidase [Clostridiales bacterium]|nr:M23 family metallopeptidase [Clostridiales bacterium]
MDKKPNTKNGGAKTVKFFKKNIYYIILIASLLAIAAIITLSLTIGGKVTNVPDNIDPDTPVDTAPATMMNPLAEFELSKRYADDELLWSSTLNLWETHLGIDLFAEKGASVVAVLDGAVESVTNSTLDGTVIVIAHAGNIKTVYKSLDQTVNVSVGQNVTRGEVIGAVGDTMLAEINEDAHLHFEVQVNGVHVNPADYLVDLIEK